MITPVAPAYSIGKASITRFSKEPIPGPTDYEPHFNARSSLPAYTFNRTPRKIHQLTDSPGPGKYLPDIIVNPKGITISKSPRALSNVRYFSPGPGDYNLEMSNSRYKYSISKAKYRSQLMTESPGPGYYSPNLDVKDEVSPRIKFTTQARMPRDTFITPAPGQYQLPSIDKTPGFSFAKAISLRKPSPIPGPGAYLTPLNTIGVAAGRRLID